MRKPIFQGFVPEAHDAAEFRMNIRSVRVEGPKHGLRDTAKVPERRVVRPRRGRSTSSLSWVAAEFRRQIEQFLGCRHDLCHIRFERDFGPMQPMGTQDTA